MLQVVNPLASQVAASYDPSASLLGDLAGQALLERFARLEAAARKIPIWGDAVNVVATDQQDFPTLCEANSVCLIHMVKRGQKWRIEPRGGPCARLIVAFDESRRWFCSPVDQMGRAEASSH